VHEADLVIYAIGIRPRDDVARTSGIDCHARGGIIVGDDLSTSAEDVYAIGECASWRENSYGLIGPGSELFEVWRRLVLVLTLFFQSKWPIFCRSTLLRPKAMLQGP
jgi:NAD(P)H-nitrite reductase large subunit